MNINGVSKNAGVYKSQSVKQKDSQRADQEKDLLKKAELKQTDSLEISDEAKKLQPVKQKVEEGFYDRPEVIREVATKLNDDLQSND